MIEIKFEPDAGKAEGRSAAYDGDLDIGECVFEKCEDVWTITHTVVGPAYSGQGIAARLVSEIAVQARMAGVTVIPVCSYSVKYFRLHAEYADVVVSAGGDVSEGDACGIRRKLK